LIIYDTYKKFLCIYLLLLSSFLKNKMTALLKTVSWNPHVIHYGQQNFKVIQILLIIN